MIHLFSNKDQTRQSYKITPTQGTFVSFFVEKYCIISRQYFVRPGVCGSKFGFAQVAALKFCFFRLIQSITTAKRTYAEVISVVENTPDDASLAARKRGRCTEKGHQEGLIILFNFLVKSPVHLRITTRQARRSAGQLQNKYISGKKVPLPSLTQHLRLSYSCFRISH